MNTVRISPARLRSDFDALAQIGATGDGGVNRPTWSQAHLDARKWFSKQAEQAGLQFASDTAGNHSAKLTCAGDNATTLLLGSHLDSVPHGGRFDGALGVLSALEVLRTVKDAGLRLAMNLEAIDFTDEEGTLVGLLGSAALAGTLGRDAIEKPRGGRAAFADAIGRAGLPEEGIFRARRDPATLGGYLEVHIEQGSRLAESGDNIGIVSAIVGITSYQLTFVGRADHAGTTAMRDRLDAAQGACAFTTSARELVLRDYPNGVANVGKMDFAPGAYNIVPERVAVSLEFRSPSENEMSQMESALLECAEEKAREYRLRLESQFVGRHKPTPMSAIVQHAFSDACAVLGLSHQTLVSGAGHDAQNLEAVCPAGMVFVPSVGGASHSPREFTDWQDCVNGANVLLHAALRIAGGQS